MKTTIGFAPTVDVDLSKPLGWPNLDGSVTVWPPCPTHRALVCDCHLRSEPEDRFPTEWNADHTIG